MNPYVLLGLLWLCAGGLVACVFSLVATVIKGGAR